MVLKVLVIMLIAIALLFTDYKVFDKGYIGRIIESILFVIYLYVVLSITVLREEHFSVPQKILIPFQSYISLLTVQWNGHGMYIAMALLGNTILFFPLGIVISWVIKKNNILFALGIGFLCSLIIETYQYFCCVGTFEVDDLIQNTWGACIGCCIGNIMDEVKNICAYEHKRIIKNVYPIGVFGALFLMCCVVSML